MAALDFPTSPTDGQVYNNWIYSTAKDAWKAKPLSGVKTVTSDTPPSNPTNGDQWFNTIDSTLYIYYTDVDGSQWVESRAPIISDGYYSPNYIINGGMDIWQRGTSFTASSSYTSDRWKVDAGTVARTTGTAGIQYALGITNASTNPALRQDIELPAAGLAGQFVTGSTWTVSFYAKTSTSVASNIAIYCAFVDASASATNAVQVVSVTNIGASSTAWTRYSYTFTVGVSPAGTNLGLEIVPYLNSGAYAGTFSVTGVQLESGSVATPFRRNANSIQGELAACQRYYWRCVSSATGYQQVSPARIVNATFGYALVTLPVQMRVEPTFELSSAAHFGLVTASDGVIACTGISIASVGTSNRTPRLACTVAAGLASGASSELVFFNQTTPSAYLGYYAEL